MRKSWKTTAFLIVWEVEGLSSTSQCMVMIKNTIWWYNCFSYLTYFKALSKESLFCESLFLHVCNWYVQWYQRISVFTWFSVQNPYSERLLKELSTKSSPCSFNLTVNFTFSTHTKFYNEYYIPHFAASFPLFYCKHLNSRHWCVLLFRLTTYLADSSSVVKFQLFIPTSLW